MTVIRDVMTADPTCVRASETVHDVARVLSDPKVGDLVQALSVD